MRAILGSIRDCFGRTGAAGPRCVPLAAKLMLSFLVVISLSSVVFTVVGVQLIGDRVVQEAQEKVRNDLNAAREIYLGELRHVSDVVVLTAARRMVREAVLARDGQMLVPDLRRVMWRHELDVLTIADETGQVLLRVGNVGRSEGSLAADDLVATVLTTRQPAAATAIVPPAELELESGFLSVLANIELVETPMARPVTTTSQRDGMMLRAVGPIFDTEDRLIGVVVGGVLLNRNFHIVDKIKRTVYQGVQFQGRDVGTATIFQNDVRISTNVLDEGGFRAIGTRVSEEVYARVVVRGERWVGRRAYVVNQWYISAYEPIRDIRQRVIGMLYVGVLEDRYTEMRHEGVRAFLGIMGAGALGSMLVALVLARRITVPLGQLVDASHDVAAGNLDAQVKVSSNDEIGELADTFNAMAAALKRRDEQLLELTRSRVMKSERLAMVGQLAAGVAHEINNPMQGIVTYALLLLEELPADDPMRESLEKIVVQANRCTRIVRGLLDFSRAKNTDRKPYDVGKVLEETMGLVAQQALFHNIEIVRDRQTDLPAVVIDPSQLQQVFMNLIINAAEAMDGQGRLTLSTRHDPGHDRVVVQVADTGHGITPEDMEKVFMPFFTTKEAGHGTGLGLAISYGIVKEHQGTISVESQPGRGTTFTVTLPVAPADEAAGDEEHG